MATLLKLLLLTVVVITPGGLVALSLTYAFRRYRTQKLPDLDFTATTRRVPRTVRA